MSNLELNIVGIDVSKETLDVTLLKVEGGKRRKRVANSPQGIEGLVAWLVRHESKQGHVCLESTSVYWEEVAETLVEVGYTVSVVNPVRIKGYGISQLRRSKTDPLDADTIADFCRTQKPAAWTPPTAVQKKLRALVRHRQALQKSLIQQTNRLGTYRDEEASASLEKVIDLLQAEIAALDARIVQFIDQHPHLRQQKELLQSIPGFGEKTSIHLMAEMYDLADYSNAKAAAADVGVTTSHYRSGTSVHKRSKMSRMGKGSIRAALYFPAITALRFNPIVKQFAARLAAKGKSKGVIRVAAMRKLIHIAYGVLKNKIPFDPNYAA